jgi:quinol monooxygenase YgiN
MQAKVGQENALAAALSALAARLRPLAGCERVEIFQAAQSAADFVFIEHWTSLEMQQAAGRQLGKEAFKEVMAVLAAAPATQTLQTVQA